MKTFNIIRASDGTRIVIYLPWFRKQQGSGHVLTREEPVGPSVEWTDAQQQVVDLAAQGWTEAVKSFANRRTYSLLNESGEDTNFLVDRDVMDPIIAAGIVTIVGATE